MSKMLVILGIHSLRQVGCMLENLRSFVIVQWGDNQNGVFEFAVKEIPVLPTLTASQELKNWYFTMKFFSQHHLYVNNTCTKFQGQKIH